MFHILLCSKMSKLTQNFLHKPASRRKLARKNLQILSCPDQAKPCKTWLQNRGKWIVPLKSCDDILYLVWKPSTRLQILSACNTPKEHGFSLPLRFWQTIKYILLFLHIPCVSCWRRVVGNLETLWLWDLQIVGNLHLNAPHKNLQHIFKPCKWQIRLVGSRESRTGLSEWFPVESGNYLIVVPFYEKPP